MWEQDGCAPIRVHGAEGGGGAPNRSTSKGENERCNKVKQRKTDF